MNKDICIGLKSYKLIFVINYETDRLKDHWRVKLILTKKLKKITGEWIIRNKRLLLKVLK